MERRRKTIHIPTTTTKKPTVKTFDSAREIVYTTIAWSRVHIPEENRKKSIFANHRTLLLYFPWLFCLIIMALFNTHFSPLNNKLLRLSFSIIIAFLFSSASRLNYGSMPLWDARARVKHRQEQRESFNPTNCLSCARGQWQQNCKLCKAF